MASPQADQKLQVVALYAYRLEIRTIMLEIPKYVIFIEIRPTSKPVS
jgi:hypothetical protein